MKPTEESERYRLYKQDIRDGMAPDADQWERMWEARDVAEEHEAENRRIDAAY
jgi:hypothetical protein